MSRTKHFSEEEMQKCQQAHEKILNITNHQRKPNKATMRCHLTPSRKAIIKKNINNCWWGCVEKELVYAAGGNVNCCSYYVRQYEGFSEN